MASNRGIGRRSRPARASAFGSPLADPYFENGYDPDRPLTKDEAAAAAKKKQQDKQMAIEAMRAFNTAARARNRGIGG